MTDRQITHAPGCWGWGPRHYECALREIELLVAEWKRVAAARGEAEARADKLRAEVERLRADRDSWEQQASDRVADWHAEHLRADKLAKALAELITWIPSADTYRRLGFDPEAPMRALGEARAALSKEEGK